MMLNLFTNCHKEAPNINLIKNTYNSFIDTFGKIPTTIYLDPNPNPELYEDYYKNLKEFFDCEIIKTNSLSDGYLKSLESNEDFIFQLEHDWNFQNINHSLEEITKLMKENNIYHFRFNKRPNNKFLKRYQSFVREKKAKIPYCETDNLSNNPHIINLQEFLKYKDLIKLDSGSFGIEENLTKKGLIGCVYGGLDYPQTIKHTRELNKKIKVFFLNDGNNNVGDMLNKPILEHFGFEVKLVGRKEKNKLIGVGSVVSAVKEGDIIFGSGSIKDKKIKLPKDVKILALRGRLTKKLLNSDCDTFGDPALLLPLIYNPKVEKKHKIGIVEHYIDKGLYKGEGYKIDVQSNWKEFVNEIKSCDKIISSSLHGLIIAEAYGIKSEWIELSNNVIGEGFKFRDYLSGTDRNSFNQELSREKLKEIQNKLIEAIKKI